MLFFDGECGLCNRIVRLLLRLDRHGALRFATLQGPSAQAFLRHHGLPVSDFDSLIFVPSWARRDRREFLRRTDGAVAALRAIGGVGGTILASLRFLPAAWRDGMYKGIARCRYRLFGKWVDRPLPRLEWRARFLE